jgi:nickel-dependent lactate racemase
MNHKFALDKNSATLALKGNPIHEDMMDSFRFLKDINIFSIQLVLTPEAKIYEVTTGDITESFNQAIKYANEIFCVPLKEKGNIVITAAPPPMDVDLYQSQKALENGKLALEKNGIIILVSQCPGGVGDKTFLDLLSRANSPNEVLKFMDEGYKLGYHKAAKIAELATRSDIWAVTSLDENIVKKAFMKPYLDIQIALDDAVETIKKRGIKPKIVVMPFGSLTVPLIGNIY